jgi:DNA-binding transcriptional MocR family regulator
VTGAVLDLTGRPRLWDDQLLRLWRAAMTRALADVDPSLRAPLGGDRMLREHLACELGVTTDRVVITSGVRSAAVAVVRHASRVLVERPTFLGVPSLLSAAGIQVTSAPWERIGDAEDGAAVWVTVPARNPDGKSPDAALLAVLREMIASGRTVVSNTTYQWFAPQAVPEGVVCVGTLHKLAGPGAQLGWVIDPQGGRDTDEALWFAAPPLHWQRAWGYFIGAGGLTVLRDRHADLATARTAFLAALGFEVAGAGPHVLLRVASSEEDAVAAAAAAAIRVSPGAAFAATEPAIRVCLFGLSPEAARLAASILGEILRMPSTPLDPAAADASAIPG